jgi:hypothetical protein
MPRGPLHILQTCPVIQRRRYKRRPHRVRRVAPLKPDTLGILAQDAINLIRMQVPPPRPSPAGSLAPAGTAARKLARDNPVYHVQPLALGPTIERVTYGATYVPRRF